MAKWQHRAWQHRISPRLLLGSRETPARGGTQTAHPHPCPHRQHPKNALPEALAEQPRGHACFSVCHGHCRRGSRERGRRGPPLPAGRAQAAPQLLPAHSKRLCLLLSPSRTPGRLLLARCQPFSAADGCRHPASPTGAGQAAALPCRHRGAQGRGVPAHPLHLVPRAERSRHVLQGPATRLRDGSTWRCTPRGSWHFGWGAPIPQSSPSSPPMSEQKRRRGRFPRWEEGTILLPPCSHHDALPWYNFEGIPPPK